MYAKLVGSSFAKPSRKLPQFLSEDLEGRFFLEVDGEGGRGLYQHEMSAILKDAKSRCPKEQIVIMLLGGNNIRNGLESIESFVGKCQQLCDTFETLDNAHFVIIGMIPSFKPISGPIFKRADSELEKLCEKYSSKISFLKVKNLFSTDEKINRALYSDDIHLNDEGTRELSFAIAQHLCK